jgi:hypothetical protein
MSSKTSHRRANAPKSTQHVTLGEIFLGLNEWCVRDVEGDVHVVSKFGQGAPTHVTVKGLTRDVVSARLAYSE